eukprot:13542806-Alexandrium_andersonii.AAC.1
MQNTLRCGRTDRHRSRVPKKRSVAEASDVRGALYAYRGTRSAKISRFKGAKKNTKRRCIGARRATIA